MDRIVEFKFRKIEARKRRGTEIWPILEEFESQYQLTILIDGMFSVNFSHYLIKNSDSVKEIYSDHGGSYIENDFDKLEDDLQRELELRIEKLEDELASKENGAD